MMQVEQQHYEQPGTGAQEEEEMEVCTVYLIINAICLEHVAVTFLLSAAYYDSANKLFHQDYGSILSPAWSNT